MSQDHLITLVDKATSEYLIQTDWTVNMQICDTLNREGNPMLCRDVVRHATKRMKEKKSRVSMLALELLETLVKNCEVTHSFVGGNEVQAEIIKLIQNKKTKEPVKERALELVQYWADSFSSRRDLPQFNQTFMLLRRAGIPFPPRRKDEPPLVFKNAPAASAAPSQRSSTQIPSNNRSESSTNLKGDLGSVQENVNLAMEMLAYTNPEEEDPAANEILKELIATCKEAMPNVRSTIESANFSSDAQMVSMLALNDELVKVQEMYDDLLARRQIFVTHGPQKKPAPQNDILDLATAFGTLNTQAPPLNPPTYQTATTPTRPLDEFDFLSGPAPPQQNITPTKATTPYPPLPAQSQPSQQSYVNPFFDSSAPAKPAGGGDLDEFDLFARGRHSTSTPPPAMSSPLQPSKPVQSTSLYFPPSTTSPTPMYSNTSSNPYNLTPAITTTASNPYNITPAANPYNSAPLATSPNNQLYGNNNVVPRATSPYNMNTTTAPAANPYNSAPLATSPNNQLYGNNNAVPRATSPYNTNPQTYGLNPTASGGAVGAPFHSSYPQGNYGQQSLQPMQPMQPMQSTQPMQPMQPLQPSYNSNPYGQPMGQNPYSLPAGGYRPQ